MARFGDAVTVNGAHAAADTNGHFEVVVNGSLVHSKSGGMGYVDSEEKEGVIIAAIQAAVTGQVATGKKSLEEEDESVSGKPEVTVSY